MYGVGPGVEEGVGSWLGQGGDAQRPEGSVSPNGLLRTYEYRFSPSSVIRKALRKYLDVA